ncbi:hypothetical protein [Desulfoferrobacter suflitae]|uniref:hypothetical protein n=1 Tax=Desulfoferrobacter suflitae TaxID=2865782 RepID=UPI0021642071|nr:hypothetical protein [Desulfoferrobacter suflitae]MCK8601752.1 hypothetical protein [Desulfoferrobacter suflitae]
MQDRSLLRHVIEKNRISMETRRVGSNPINVQEDGLDEPKHYKCSLYRPGRRVEVYLSVGASAAVPTLPDVLLMLAMDASGCEMLEGLDQYRDEWPVIFGASDGNLQEIESFWQEYQVRCEQTEQFKKFLGAPIYNELLRCFEHENPLTDLASALSEQLA